MINIYKIVLLTFFLAYSSISASDDKYHIGYKKLEVSLKESSKTFPVAIIYPTDTPEKQVQFGPFNVELSINAPVIDKKFPLVVISHGSGGTNLGHRSIAFELVKNGFVVAMPLHPNNNYKDNSAEGTNKNWINRPKHIKWVIDSIGSNPNFSKYVNTDNVSILGHSAGGYTALAVAGAMADTSHLADLCRNHAKENKVFCDLGSDISANFTSTRIENKRDDRIKAIVVMAPVGVLFKSKKSLDNITASMLLLRAEKDSQLIEPHHSELIAKRYINKEKLTYRTIKNAGHYSFITPFPKSISGRLGEVSKDPDGFDRESFHKQLSADISAYLIKTIKQK